MGAILGAEVSTVAYTYGNASWGDLLTKYGSTTITYDSIGNPTKIGYYDLTWQGRELQSWSDDESTTVYYGYNSDGIRTYKEILDDVNGYGTRHEYILDGGTILYEIVYDVTPTTKTESYIVVYLYDENGAPVGMKYRTPSYGDSQFDTYFFEKNLQGDIIAVYNGAGAKLCTFKYDAWGYSTISYESGINSVTKRFLNSHCVFRYRGYYYDSETGYYYLQSRYYNPTWGRFINADEYINANGDIIGYNMFAYCSNNPVMFVDPTGESITALAIVAGIFASTALGAIIGALYSVGETLGEDPGASQKEIWASMAKGAISGGLMGLASGILTVTGGSAGFVVGVYAAAGFGGNFIGSITENAILGETLIDLDVLDSSLQGAVFGAIAGGIAGPLPGLKKLAKQYGTTYAKQAIRFGKNSYKHMVGSALEGGLSSFYELYIDRTILLFCNTATGRTK